MWHIRGASGTMQNSECVTHMTLFWPSIVEQNQYVEYVLALSITGISTRMQNDAEGIIRIC